MIIHLILSFILVICTLYLCFYYTNASNSLSSIASQKEMNLISNWINPNTTTKYSLIYKASVDGDSSEIFHKKCDSVKHTVTLISTLNGWKFGGYTDSSWESSRGSWYTDEYKRTYHTFIFSLSLKKKYPSNSQFSKIGCLFEKGPIFGEGPDISIENYSLNTLSKCYSPHSFGNMKKMNEFNGGDKEFIAKEIEVFKVEME